jgi:hypothetical protein
MMMYHHRLQLLHDRVQLTERRQKPAKSLSELGQAIRRLVNLAYPTVPENVRDTLAKQHFIEALAEFDSQSISII